MTLRVRHARRESNLGWQVAVRLAALLNALFNNVLGLLFTDGPQSGYPRVHGRSRRTRVSGARRRTCVWPGRRRPVPLRGWRRRRRRGRWPATARLLALTGSGAHTVRGGPTGAVVVGHVVLRVLVRAVLVVEAMSRGPGVAPVAAIGRAACHPTVRTLPQ